MSRLRKFIFILFGLTAALATIGALNAKLEMIEPCIHARPRVPSRMSLARRS